MDRKLRNRILLYLLLAGVLAYVGIELSGRKPAPKISAVAPMRENLTSSISSNGKVEPIGPSVMRAQLDTLVMKVLVSEGQAVKKGQLLMKRRKPRVIWQRGKQNATNSRKTMRRWCVWSRNRRRQKKSWRPTNCR